MYQSALDKVQYCQHSSVITALKNKSKNNMIVLKAITSDTFKLKNYFICF
jgi:hypothetical protein